MVTDALEVGYRMIDTAASYRNEQQVGDAIRNSGLKREELFITTKLWVQDHEYDDTLRAFDLSMKKLGLDYLDLYLIHKPYGNYYAAWRAMERLYKEGRIRAIGVTSFSSERLQDLFLHNEVKPAVNQLETHPFFQQREANAFLQHMVRNIVGSLIYVGTGRESVQWLADVLHAKSRAVAAPTFDPSGLYLTGVEYPSQLELPVGGLSPFVF